MGEWSFPYGSVNHDRRYKSADFRNYYAQLIGNGVFYTNSTALKVSEGGGMNVTLAKGSAFIEGAGYKNTAPLNFILDTADGALPRIDRLVIRNDYTNRDTYAAVLKGSYSAQPQPTAITRNADCYEIAIADILVPGGAVSITQANITDNRLNNDLCGVVTGLIEQADTTEIFNQFEAYLTEFKQQHISEMENWTEMQEADMTEWMREQKADFLLWVDEIKDILDETVAGNLQVEIEKAKADLSEDVFKRFYGLINQESEWMPDGSIVVTNAEATLTIVKGTNEDGYKVIKETLSPADTEIKYTKTTTFYPKTTSTNKRIVEAYSYELE
jgi:hypothetical protein